METDTFFTLEKLKIGEQISSITLQTQGGQVLSKPDKLESEPVILSFSSVDYSHPHLVYLLNGKISFIQLTIPQKQQEEYQNLLTSLGDPEVNLRKTETTTMLGFPSQGIDFVVSYVGGPVNRVQKFAPKTDIEFVQDEGKNFFPVESKDTKVSVVITSPSPQLGVQESKVPVLTFVILGLLIVLFVIGLILIKRNRLIKRSLNNPPKSI